MLLDLPVHGGYPVTRDPAPIIQAQLREVGIDVNVQNLAVPAWLEAGRAGNQHIGTLIWGGADPDLNLRLVYHSDNVGAFAWTRHSNTELDELLEEGMVALDPEERCAIYEEVQRIIMEDALMKPLNLYSSVWGMRSVVKGLKIDELTPGWFWAFDTYLEQ
jgi:peptide/nickel transport system substrate-binding protein